MVKRSAQLDGDLARELQALSTQDDPYETHVGKTMCTYDFYEGITYEFVIIQFFDVKTLFSYRARSFGWSLLRLHGEGET